MCIVRDKTVFRVVAMYNKSNCAGTDSDESIRGDYDLARSKEKKNH